MPGNIPKGAFRLELCGLAGQADITQKVVVEQAKAPTRAFQIKRVAQQRKDRQGRTRVALYGRKGDGHGSLHSGLRDGLKDFHHRG